MGRRRARSPRGPVVAGGPRAVGVPLLPGRGRQPSRRARRVGSVGRGSRARARGRGSGPSDAARPGRGGHSRVCEPSRRGSRPGPRTVAGRWPGRPSGKGLSPEHATQRPRSLPGRERRRPQPLVARSGASHDARGREGRPRDPPLPDVRSLDGMDPLPMRGPHRADRAHHLRGAADRSPLERCARAHAHRKTPGGEGRQGTHLPGQGARGDREGDPPGLARDLRLPGRHRSLRPHRPPADALPSRRDRHRRRDPAAARLRPGLDGSAAHRRGTAGGARAAGPHRRPLVRDVPHASCPVRGR